MLDWVLRGPSLLSAFSKLGYKLEDGYHINETCNEGLQSILQSLSAEDRSVRQYRRGIGFGQYIQRDLVPILLASQQEKTTDLTIKILADLTLPVESLFPRDSNTLSKHMTFEINNMLQSAKATFADYKVTKVVIDYLKRNTDVEHSFTLSAEQCENINDCLTLLRNLLYQPAELGKVKAMPVVPLSVISTAPTAVMSTVSAMTAAVMPVVTTVGPAVTTVGMPLMPAVAGVMPEMPAVAGVMPVEQAVASVMPVMPVVMPVVPALTVAPGMRPAPMMPVIVSPSAVHKQIIWNIFSHGLDEILIKLMTVPEAEFWCLTMVEILGLLYKNQSAGTIQKLVSDWLGTSSESSEEDETNTSPANRDSKESSPLLTTDPTSDSSDSKGNDAVKRKEATKDQQASKKVGEPPWRTLARSRLIKPENVAKHVATTKRSGMTTVDLTTCTTEPVIKKERPNVNVKMAHWDPSFECDCSRQPVLTSSSNEDEIKQKLHPKLHNPKHKVNVNAKPLTQRQIKKRKLIHRARSTKSKVHGKMIRWPNEGDIAQVLKEFTIDFLLKSFNTLVQTLHGHMLTNYCIEIDTSHFFWLVSYFLKFVTEMELDMEQVNFVLSFEMVSYFTAESVNICEQFNMVIKQCGCDPHGLMQRQHMLVAAIREFVRAIHMYTQHIQMMPEDRSVLLALQEKMCATEELRSLFVLLLRHYNPKHQTKQYLQDLIIANHNLLVFLEIIMKTPKFKSHTSLKEHLKQFATVEMMHQYGSILEDYKSNGAFVNDCVFTLMHHVGGECDTLKTLFQPNILQTFTAILKSKFVISENWSDLIEYAINSFIMKPQALQLGNTYRLKKHTVGDGHMKRPIYMRRNLLTAEIVEKEPSIVEEPPEEIWTEEEISALGWHYLQCEKASDLVGQIVEQLRDEAVFKSRPSVLKELHKQKLIDTLEYEKLAENSQNQTIKPPPKEPLTDEIGILCEELSHDGRGKFLSWVQMLLLDTCFAKIYLEKLRNLIKFKVKCKGSCSSSVDDEDFVDAKTFELFKGTDGDSNFPVVSPVAGHFLLLNESVPVVPWNSEQAAICKDLRFLHLLDCLGFQMPDDTGKLFIRVPCNWSAQHLYDLAGKVGFIDPSKLKFSVNSPSDPPGKPSLFARTKGPHLGPDNYYQIRKQNICAAVLNIPLRPMSFGMPTCMESEASTSYASVTEPQSKDDWLAVISTSKENKKHMKLKHEILEEFEWSEVCVEPPPKPCHSKTCHCREHPPAPSAPPPPTTVLVVPADNPLLFDSDDDYTSSSDTESSLASNMSCMGVASDKGYKLPTPMPHVALNLKRRAPEDSCSTIQNSPPPPL